MYKTDSHVIFKYKNSFEESQEIRKEANKPEKIVVGDTPGKLTSADTLWRHQSVRRTNLNFDLFTHRAAGVIGYIRGVAVVLLGLDWDSVHMFAICLPIR